MTVIEVLVDQLESTLIQAIRDNLDQPDFSAANLALDAIEKKLDQAMIYDKTVRTRLEADLRNIRSSIRSSNGEAQGTTTKLNPTTAKAGLEIFRGSFQANFRAGHIL